MEDYIDTSVFLAVVFDEKEARICRSYLNVVGYKEKTCGTISHLVISEAFTNILTKTTYQDTFRTGYQMLELFRALLTNDQVTICKLEEPQQELFAYIQNADYQFSCDDTLHLVAAIMQGCRRFITIDKILLKAIRLRRSLEKEFQLHIISPF